MTPFLNVFSCFNCSKYVCINDINAAINRTRNKHRAMNASENVNISFTFEQSSFTPEQSLVLIFEAT